MDKGVLYKWTLCRDTVITEEKNMSINGEFLLPDGTVVHDSGIYISNLTSLYGCDSTIITQIALLDCKDTTVVENRLEVGELNEGIYF